MRKNDRARLGRWAEDVALEMLSGHGLRAETRNYRCRLGEIDLIMRDGEAVVFVEVRFRGRSSYASAAESVDSRKQRRLVAAARHFLQSNPHLRHEMCRFDVVGVSPRGDASGVPPAYDIDWIRSAFQS